jgi:hypothetical protein
LVLSLGKTQEDALIDLREAAHQGVNTLIDLKLHDLENQ